MSIKLHYNVERVDLDDPDYFLLVEHHDYRDGWYLYQSVYDVSGTFVRTDKLGWFRDFNDGHGFSFSDYRKQPDPYDLEFSAAVQEAFKVIRWLRCSPLSETSKRWSMRDQIEIEDF